MRYRVDTRFGSASFDEKDEAKALELYRESGLRLSWCRGLDDDGEVIEGLPPSMPAPAKWLAS